MKKVLLFSLIIFSFTSSAFTINDKELFIKMREANNKNLPVDFTAVVSSPDIVKSLNEIPVRSRKGTPFVLFLFHKKYGERIIVKNVDEIYKDRFAVYLNMYVDFKTFLKKELSYETFAKKYEWKLERTVQGKYTIKMRKKVSSEKDYFHLNVNSRTLLIENVVKFTSGKPADTFNITYKKYGNFLIPVKLSFNGKIENRQRNFTFNLDNVKINTGLKEQDFLD